MLSSEMDPMTRGADGSTELCAYLQWEGILCQMYQNIQLIIVGIRHNYVC